MAPTRAHPEQGWRYSIRDEDDPSDEDDSPAPSPAPPPRRLTEQDLLITEAEEEQGDDSERIDIGEVEENVTFVETPFSIAARLAASRRRKEEYEREEVGWELEPAPTPSAAVAQPTKPKTQKLNPLQQGFLRQAALASTRPPPNKTDPKAVKKASAGTSKAKKELAVLEVMVAASEGSGERPSSSKQLSLPARTSNAPSSGRPLAPAPPPPSTPPAPHLRPPKRPLSPKPQRIVPYAPTSKIPVPVLVPQPQPLSKKPPAQVYKSASIPATVPLPRPLVKKPPPLVPRITKQGLSSEFRTEMEMSASPSASAGPHSSPPAPSLSAFRPAKSPLNSSPHPRPPKRPLASSPLASPIPAHPLSSTSDSSSRDSSLLHHSRPTSSTTSSPPSSPHSRPKPSYRPLLLHPNPRPTSSPRHMKKIATSPAKTWSTLTPNLLPKPSFYGSALPSSTYTALATKFALPGLAGTKGKKGFKPAESLEEFKARMRREEVGREEGEGREEVRLGTAVRSVRSEEGKGKRVLL